MLVVSCRGRGPGSCGRVAFEEAQRIRVARLQVLLRRELIPSTTALLLKRPKKKLRPRKCHGVSKAEGMLLREARLCSEDGPKGASSECTQGTLHMLRRVTISDKY